MDHVVGMQLLEIALAFHGSIERKVSSASMCFIC